MPKFISDDEMTKIEGGAKKRFISDDEMSAKTSAPSTSSAETLLRSGTQGFSGGFQDELAGAMSAAGRVVGLENIGGKVSDWGLADEGPTLDWDKISDQYYKNRDSERAENRKAKEANPGLYMTGEVAGTIGQNIAFPGLNAAKGAGLAANVGKGMLQAGIAGAGHSDADNALDLAADTAMASTVGAAGGGAAYGIGKLANKVPGAFSRGADYLDEAAENFAIKATGATGKQTEKFADDAGRQLLDRGLVRFGDSAEAIAGRVGAQMDEAGNNISKALSTLDERGITASNENVVKQIQARIAELSSDPSQASLVGKLQKIIEDIRGPSQEMSRMSAKDLADMEWRKAIGSDIPPQANPMNIPISKAEEIKRGFGSKIKNWLDPEAGAANKETYRAYMDEVERAARDASDKMSGLFEESKKTYGLLAPIEEAASKRAAQLNQSPFGGLGDIAATAAGGGNPIYAAGRRAIAPRLASSAAWSADKLADAVRATPEMFGKYSKVLQDAAQRGPNGVASVHFLLQQQDEGYREMMRQIADKE